MIRKLFLPCFALGLPAAALADWTVVNEESRLSLSLIHI